MILRLKHCDDNEWQWAVVLVAAAETVCCNLEMATALAAAPMAAAAKFVVSTPPSFAWHVISLGEIAFLLVPLMATYTHWVTVDSKAKWCTLCCCCCHLHFFSRKCCGCHLQLVVTWEFGMAAAICTALLLLPPPYLLLRWLPSLSVVVASKILLSLVCWAVADTLTAWQELLLMSPPLHCDTVVTTYVPLACAECLILAYLFPPSDSNYALAATMHPALHCCQCPLLAVVLAIVDFVVFEF